MQGHLLNLSQQEFIVPQFIVDLMLTIGMEINIEGFSDLEDNVHAIEFDCATEYSSITNFVEDLGHFEMTRLSSLDDQTGATLLDNITPLIYGIAQGFLEYVGILDGHYDTNVYRALSTNPIELVKLKELNIALPVEQQKELLDAL